MLSNEGFNQILEHFSKKNFRFTMRNANFSEISTQVLKLGELVNVTNLGVVKLGDGLNPAYNLKNLIPEGSEIQINDNAELQAQKLWSLAYSKMTLYETQELIVPETMIEPFILHKPVTFSLMLGEAIPDTSPAFQFMQTAPNAKGSVLRNISHGDAERDPDGVDLSPGQYQAGVMEEHGHDLSPLLPGPTGKLKSSWTVSAQANRGNIRSSNPRTPSNITQLDNEDYVSDRETRANNNRVVIIWRIA